MILLVILTTARLTSTRVWPWLSLTSTHICMSLTVTCLNTYVPVPDCPLLQHVSLTVLLQHVCVCPWMPLTSTHVRVPDCPLFQRMCACPWLSLTPAHVCLSLLHWPHQLIFMIVTEMEVKRSSENTPEFKSLERYEQINNRSNSEMPVSNQFRSLALLCYLTMKN